MAVDIKRYNNMDMVRLVGDWEKLTPYMQKLMAQTLLERLLLACSDRQNLVDKIQKALEEYYD